MSLFSFLFFHIFVTGAQGILQLRFLDRFTKKGLKLPYCIAYFIIFLVSLNLWELLFHSSLASTLCNVALLYGTSRLLMKNKRPVSFTASLLAASIMQLSFGALDSLVCLLLPYLPGPSIWGLWLSYGFSVASLLFCFWCYRILSSRFPWSEDRSCPYINLLLAPLLFFLAIGFYIVNVSYGNVVTIPYPSEPYKHTGLLVIQLLGFGAIFSTLYAYQKLQESFGIKSRLALLEQEANSQKAYVAEAKKRYDQTRSFRHDFKNHLSVLDGLIKSGSLEKAGDYLEKLNTVCAGLSFPFHTGNPIVDILLCSKLEFTGRDHIETDISLTLPHPCAIDDFDLCVIFSNALDNALSACGKCKCPCHIHVRGEQQGSFYMLEFENSCQPFANNQFQQGTGLSNIRAAAQKYGGAVTVERRQDLFLLHVLLNISLQTDNIPEQKN